MPTEPFYLGDGTPLPWLGIAAKQFLDRSTVLYGPSGTGKTVGTKAIMKVLCDHIDQVILVSPTEPQNKSYRGIVPSLVTHHRIWLPSVNDSKGGRDGGMRFFDRIWARQEVATALYRRANDLKALEKLFERVADDPARKSRRKIERYRVRGLADIRRANRGGEMERRIQNFEEQIEKVKQAFFKKHILGSFQELDAANLEKDERFSLTHIQFNPRMLIILDDCAADLTPAIVKSPVFRKIFFQGRHSMITAIVACHTPNDLPPGLRKNTFNCLFTDDDTAVSYFSTKTNGFTNAMRKRAEAIIEEVFASEDKEHPFMKFAYIRDSTQKFYVYEVEYPRSFRFGSDALWEAEDEGAATGEAIDPGNEFYDAYGLGEPAEDPAKVLEAEEKRKKKR